jgi:uncharacterized membrane protein
MESIVKNPMLESIIGSIAAGLEIIAVAIICITILIALLRFIRLVLQHKTAKLCIKEFKKIITTGVQFALEILIAADIINTVILSDTLENVAILAFLVVIRTFISWELHIESEGRWPFSKKSE